MEGRRAGKKETTRRLETEEGKEEGVGVWKGENMRGYQYHIHSPERQERHNKSIQT